jgi:signal peptidase I
MRRLLNTLFTLFLLSALVTAALMILPAALGMQRYIITTGSMTGTYDPGSVVFDKPVQQSDLRVGDVITYRPPLDSGHKGLVTHRIVRMGRDARGLLELRTKGDANNVADPWKFSMTGGRAQRVVASVPYVGYIFAELTQRTVRMLVIGAPALLIFLMAAASFRREAREAESLAPVQA